MLKFITPNKINASANMFCKEFEATQLGEECVDMETTTINLSEKLSTEDALFNNRDSENQVNALTTSNKEKRYNTRKENIGDSSDKIVNDAVMTEDDVTNTIGIIERMKDMNKCKYLVFKKNLDPNSVSLVNKEVLTMPK